MLVDNSLVMHNYVNGPSACPEDNSMVAFLWLWIAQLRADVVFYRVESKAGIADGPTRFVAVTYTRSGAGVMRFLHPHATSVRPSVIASWLSITWVAFLD